MEWAIPRRVKGGEGTRGPEAGCGERKRGRRELASLEHRFQDLDYLGFTLGLGGVGLTIANKSLTFNVCRVKLR